MIEIIDWDARERAKLQAIMTPEEQRKYAALEKAIDDCETNLYWLKKDARRMRARVRARAKRRAG